MGVKFSCINQITIYRKKQTINDLNNYISQLCNKIPVSTKTIQNILSEKKDLRSKALRSSCSYDQQLWHQSLN